MSSLRVVISFPDTYDVERQTAVLGELQQALKDQMGLDQRLSRLPELTLPGTAAPAAKAADAEQEVALRVFLLEFSERDAGASALRAVGGWYMRYPSLTVSFKADGPRGGVNMRLTSFSTIAYAQVVSKINELMEPAEDEG